MRTPDFKILKSPTGKNFDQMKRREENEKS
jgi:hypothetical protein